MAAGKKRLVSFDEIERAIAFYQSRIDELSGDIGSTDRPAVAILNPQRKKKDVFKLIAKLRAGLGQVRSVRGFYCMAVEAIAEHLNVNRVYIMEPGEQANTYKALYWRGLEHLNELEVAKFRATSFEFPVEFSEERSKTILFTASSFPTNETLQLSRILEMPSFACVPVFADGKNQGMIVVGRTREFDNEFPQLDDKDIETLVTISGLITTIILKTRVKALRDADKMKTEFFANLAHDLRTPITLTLGAAENVLNGHVGDIESKRLLSQISIIKKNQSRLLNLINQILDLEKLESRKVHLRVQRVRDFNQFLYRRLEQFSTLTDKKGVQLMFNGAESIDDAPIYFDADRFDRMVFNLLSNAVKFTNSGYIRLESFITKERYGIRLIDTGTGIKADQLEFIFDRFRQAKHNASSAYAGTGIGLSLVKQIAEMHGGEVTVQSVYGTGTTFEVALPLTSDHFDPTDVSEEVYFESDVMMPVGREYEIEECHATQDDRKLIEKLNEASALSHQSERGTVLFVDDSHDTRIYAYELLSQEFNIYLACDGIDGLEKANAIHPDVILSDMMMPMMDGDQFLAAVRKDSALKHSSFIILTTKPGEDCKIASLLGGADDYLSKPFSEGELKARLRNLILSKMQDKKIREKATSFLGVAVAEAIYENKPHLLESRLVKAITLQMDMRGFTEFYTKNDPAMVKAFMHEFHTSVAHEVTRFGGYWHKSVGDAQLASFGAIEIAPYLVIDGGISGGDSGNEQILKAFYFTEAMKAIDSIICNFCIAKSNFGIKDSLSLGVGVAFGDLEVRVQGDTSAKLELDIDGTTIIRSARLEEYSKNIRAAKAPRSSVLVLAPELADVAPMSKFLEWKIDASHLLVRNFPDINRLLYRVYSDADMEIMRQVA